MYQKGTYMCMIYVYQIRSHVRSSLPRSLSSGNFFKNGTGLSNLFFFLGNPITVFSAPFGRPRFFNLGGSVTSCRAIDKPKHPK